MSTLIICLPALAPGVSPGALASAAPSYDYVVTSDGRAVTSQSSSPASLLPAAVRGSEAVAVVPVSMLSWHRVDIPKGVGMASPRVRVVLDSLLEDRLLDEPEQLHLALAPGATAGTPSWVAACDKQWLRSHLQALEAAGRPVARVVPEFSPDAGPLQLHVVGPEDAPQLVATGEAVGGLKCLPLSGAALSMLTASVLGSTAGLQGVDEPQDDVPVFAEPAHVALAEQLMQRKVSLLTRPQRWLDAARSPWDLAQFDLSSTGRSRTVKRLSGAGRDLWRSSLWKPARWGLIVLLLANLVGLNAWAWKEQSALKTQRAAIEGALTQTFPQVKVVVDAPLQMERQVAVLRQATGASSGRDLETMLAALGAVLPASQKASAIEFAAGEVRLKGLSLEVAEMALLSAQLKGLNYAVRQESDVLVMQAAQAATAAQSPSKDAP
jgi:general secretion pathway protein L